MNTLLVDYGVIEKSEPREPHRMQRGEAVYNYNRYFPVRGAGNWPKTQPNGYVKDFAENVVEVAYYEPEGDLVVIENFEDMEWDRRYNRWYIYIKPKRSKMREKLLLHYAKKADEVLAKRRALLEEL